MNSIEGVPFEGSPKLFDEEIAVSSCIVAGFNKVGDVLFWVAVSTELLKFGWMVGVTLVGGLRAFDHTVVVEGETIQTLALYMEGDASHMTYCPSGESVFGGHAEKPTSFVDSSRSCEFLSRRLASSDRVFFLPCLDSPEREDEAAKPETLALQRASWLVNKPPLPHLFEDGVVERTLYTPDTTLDKPIPFLFEWTTLLMGRCGSLPFGCDLIDTGLARNHNWLVFLIAKPMSVRRD
ncbi:hypothetical protein H6P81_006717 [Aristolochia fimbriata]|uniref:Uncharacterized protein n=1 Tax=Aristolochia fimbriata TaxID=158543 RepID=A0AAV7F2M2_ARIFI|nr:hypothetical protein H6P81_006717 [Aristolochia fimbriata]